MAEVDDLDVFSAEDATPQPMPDPEVELYPDIIDGTPAPEPVYITPTDMFPPSEVPVFQNIGNLRNAMLRTTERGHMPDDWNGIAAEFRRRGQKIPAQPYGVDETGRVSMLMERELGKDWDKPGLPGDATALLTAGTFKDLVESQPRSAKDDTPANEEWIWSKVQPLFKSTGALGIQKGADLYRQVQLLEHAAQNVPFSFRGGPVSAADPDSELALNFWAAAVTGKDSLSLSRSDRVTAVLPVMGAMAELRDRARIATRYQALGLQVNPDHVSKVYGLPVAKIAQEWFPDELSRSVLLNIRDLSLRNPEWAALRRTDKQMAELLNLPEGINKIMPDIPGAFYGDLRKKLKANLENTPAEERLAKFNRLTARWSNALAVSKFFHPSSLQHGLTVQDAYANSTEAVTRYYQGLYNRNLDSHVQELEEFNTLYPDINTADAAAQIAEAAKGGLNQIAGAYDARETARQRNWLVQTYELPMRAVTGILNITGLSTVLGELDREVAPLTEGLKNFISESPLWPDALEKAPLVPESVYDTYVTKKRTGKASWLDDIAVLGWSMWDDVMRLPQVIAASPITSAVLIGGLGATVKNRRAILEKMAKAGMPRAAVAGAAFFLEPENQIRPITVMLGLNPAQIAKYGVTARKVARLWNKYGGSVEFSEGMTALRERLVNIAARLDRPEEGVGDAPTHIRTAAASMRAYSNAVEVLANRAREGQHISVTEVSDVMDLGLEVPADYAAPMLIPSAHLPTARLRSTTAGAAMLRSELESIGEIDVAMQQLGVDPKGAPKGARPLSELFLDVVETQRQLNREHVERWFLGDEEYDARARGASPEARKTGLMQERPVFNQLMDKWIPKINRLLAAPQALKDWGAAYVAWRGSSQKARNLMQTMGGIDAILEKDITGLRSTTDAHTATIATSKQAVNALNQRIKTEPSGSIKATGLRAVKAQLEGEIVALNERIAADAAQGQILIPLQNKLRQHIAHISELSRQGLRRTESWPTLQGLEHGYDMALTMNERMIISRHLVDVLAMVRGNYARFGIGQAWFKTFVRAEGEIRAEAESAAAMAEIRREQRAQARQQKINSEIDPEDPLTQLDEGKLGPHQESRAEAKLRLLNEWAAARRELMASDGSVDTINRVDDANRAMAELDESIHNRLARQLAKDKELWGIAPHEETVRAQIEGTRRRGEQYKKGLLEAPPYGMLSMLKGWRVPYMASRMVADIGTAIEGSASSTQFLNSTLKRVYNDLPKDLQLLADEMLSGAHPYTPPDVAPLLDHLVRNDRRVRLYVADAAYRMGHIDEDMHRRILEENYVPHYYLEYTMGRQLHDLGFEGQGTTTTPLPASPAKLKQYKVQESPDAVRVFWRSPDGKLHEERFPVQPPKPEGDWSDLPDLDPADGAPLNDIPYIPAEEVPVVTAADAMRNAEAWSQQQLDSGNLLPQDIYPPVKSLSEFAMISAGLLEGNKFRYDALQRMINGVERLEFFRQVAQNGDWARLSIQGLPLKVQGTFTAAPLKGREWGALEGYYVSHDMFRHINEWAHYSRVIDNIAKSLKEQVGQMFSTSAIEQSWRGGITETLEQRLGEASVVGRLVVPFVRRGGQILETITHNLIVRSAETWATSHASDMISAWMSGINPFSRQYWADYHEHNTIAAQYSEGNLPKVDKTPIDTTDYSTLSGRGLLTETIGVSPTKLGHELKKTPLKSVLTEVGKQHDRKVKDLLDDLANIDAKIKDIEEALTYPLQLAKRMGLKELSEKQLKELEDQGEKFRGLREDTEDKLAQVSTYNPMARLAQWTLGYRAEGRAVPYTGKLRTVKAATDEMGAALTNVDDSVLSQWLSIRYSEIDAAHKYATYKGLIRQGHDPDIALTFLDEYFQNYNRVPSWIRNLKNIPLLGAFVPSFPYEAQRIVRGMARVDPAKLAVIPGAILAANMASFTSQAQLPSDVQMAQGIESDADWNWNLLTNVYIPDLNGGYYRLNTGKYLMTSSLTYPSGVLAPGLAATSDAVEKQFGSLAGFLARGTQNFISNFVGNKPFLTSSLKAATGIDVFRKEVIIRQNTDYDLATTYAREIGSLMVPRTLREVKDAFSKPAAPSTVTGHQRGFLMSMLAALAGVNFTQYRKSEALGGMAIKYADPDRLDAVFKEMQSRDRTNATNIMREARLALDTGAYGDYQDLTLQATNLLMADWAQRGRMYISGAWKQLGKSRPEILREVMAYVGKDVYNTIDRVPIDMMPDLALDAWSSTFVEHDGPEMAYIWRQMQDPAKLSSFPTFEPLLRGVYKVAGMLDTIDNPKLQKQLRGSYLSMVSALGQTLARVAKKEHPLEVLRDLGNSTPGNYRLNLQRVLQHPVFAPLFQSPANNVTAGTPRQSSTAPK